MFPFKKATAENIALHQEMDTLKLQMANQIGNHNQTNEEVQELRTINQKQDQTISEMKKMIRTLVEKMNQHNITKQGVFQITI